MHPIHDLRSRLSKMDGTDARYTRIPQVTDGRDDQEARKRLDADAPGWPDPHTGPRHRQRRAFREHWLLLAGATFFLASLVLSVPSLRVSGAHCTRQLSPYCKPTPNPPVLASLTDIDTAGREQRLRSMRSRTTTSSSTAPSAGQPHIAGRPAQRLTQHGTSSPAVRPSPHSPPSLPVSL